MTTQSKETAICMQGLVDPQRVTQLRVAAALLKPLGKSYSLENKVGHDDAYLNLQCLCCKCLLVLILGR